MAIHYETTLDRTFHALGDGTRRQMLAMLANKSFLSASELHAPFEVSQPTISKHIKVLERAQLITRKVDGRVHRFKINTEQLVRAQQWIADNSVFWEGALDQLGEFLQKNEK